MFEAYKIGVTLALTNQVSSGLAKMAKDFAKTDAEATALQKRIDGIQKMAVRGGMFLGVGLGMLALFKKPLDEAAKFDQALGKFKLFGLGDAQNADAVKFVRSMDVMGTSYTENLKLMTEAQGVFRESGLAGPAALDGAKLAAPMLAKMQFASAGLDDESKEKMHTQSMAMLRFVEMRGGLKDAKTFNSIADSGWKAIQSSGGNVNFEQLRQFMARGGVAAQGLNDEALYAKLEPVIGELKGSTAGNALMTSYNRLVGGVRVPNQIAHLLADNGIWDKSKITWNSQGGIKQVNGNPLRDMSTFASDPVAFYEKTILPVYAKMNHGKGMNTEERARENTMIFGRTGGMMFSLIDRQLETIHRSTSAWEQALGVNKSAKVASETAEGKKIILEAQWAKVMTDLGNIILPFAISGTQKLINMLTGLDGWMNRNEGTVKLLVGAFTLLAGGLAIRGAVLLLTSAFQGLGLALMFKTVGGIPGMERVGGALGLIGTRLSQVLAVGQAFGIGWAVGTLLNDAFISGTKFGDWLGGFIAKILAFMGNKEAQAAVEANKSAYEKGLDKVRTDGDAKDGEVGKRIYSKPWFGPGGTFFSEQREKPPAKDLGGHVFSMPRSSFGAIRQPSETAIGWKAPEFPLMTMEAPTVLAIPHVGDSASNVAPAPQRASEWRSSAMVATAPAAQPTASPAQTAEAIKAALDGAYIKMDGEQVGRLVTNFQSRESGRPSTGTSGFDPRMTALRPDFGY